MSALRAALLAAVATAFLPTLATADEMAQKTTQMRVAYDQAVAMKLEKPAKTVVVGNASIADAMLISDKLVYVQGRMFGNTNVIALDAQGNEVANTLVTVTTPTIQQVSLYRGPNGQRNLACAPQCERTLTQGDVEITGISEGVEKKNAIAEKGAQLSVGR